MRCRSWTPSSRRIQGDPKLLELQYRLLDRHQALPPSDSDRRRGHQGRHRVRRHAVRAAPDGRVRGRQQPHQGSRDGTAGIDEVPEQRVADAARSAGAERDGGQIVQAKTLLLQILQKDPKNANAADAPDEHTMQAGNPDSTLYAMHQAITAGVPPSTVAPVALSQGNKYYRTGNQLTRNADTLDVAIKFLSYSDTLVAGYQTQVPLGRFGVHRRIRGGAASIERQELPGIEEIGDGLLHGHTDLRAGRIAGPGLVGRREADPLRTAAAQSIRPEGSQSLLQVAATT